MSYFGLGKYAHLQVFRPGDMSLRFEVARLEVAYESFWNGGLDKAVIFSWFQL